MDLLGSESAYPLDKVVDILLVGGPDDMRHSDRKRRAAIVDTKIKIEHCGGYEHFQMERGPGDLNGSSPVVFRWFMRTKIAE
ncbi:DUF5988 family protein [Streptomyces sp. NPDC046976]|uniref:DUF5988 family protein n=1 Tax=Streptomyces sp. NPDC046976 TaxID=3155258 RepID=UPI0034088C91